MMRRTSRNERGWIMVRTSAGTVGLFLSEMGIKRIELPCRGKRASSRASGSPSDRRENVPSSIGNRAAMLLRRYFSGDRVAFHLPLDLGRTTDFQKAVWKAASEIPYGETRSYAWIAKRIGRPKAARAVGQALGANPVPVLIPCHRVISSQGTLGGFSGGLAMKRRLLGLEARPVCADARRMKKNDR